MPMTCVLILQVTVKAGSCRQQYNSLNAECATMKQGLANLGLNSQTVEQKPDSLSGSQVTGMASAPLMMLLCSRAKRRLFLLQDEVSGRPHSSALSKDNC